MFHSLRAFAVYAGLLMCHEHLHMLPDVWNCTCAVVLWMQYIEFPVLSLVLAGAAADLPCRGAWLHGGHLSTLGHCIRPVS